MKNKANNNINLKTVNSFTQWIRWWAIFKLDIITVQEHVNNLNKGSSGTIIVWFWLKKRVNYIGWARLRKTSATKLKHGLLLISTAARPTSRSLFFSSSFLRPSVSLDGPEAALLISGAAVFTMWDQKRCRSINEHMVNKHGAHVEHVWINAANAVVAAAEKGYLLPYIDLPAGCFLQSCLTNQELQRWEETTAPGLVTHGGLPAWDNNQKPSGRLSFSACISFPPQPPLSCYWPVAPPSSSCPANVQPQRHPEKQMVKIRVP